MSPNIRLKLIAIISLMALTSSREVPKLSSAHAKIGNYSNMNMQSCGYLSPKDRPKVVSRIIDGEFSELGEFPWHAAIYVKNQMGKRHLCGGALIHQFWVLTAKQCFLKPNESPIEANNLIVSFGSIKKQEFYATYAVLSVFDHSHENLTLLRLGQAVIPTQSSSGSDYRINFVCLPMGMIINTYNEDAIVSGFGYTQTDNKPPNERLRKATFLIDPFMDCDKRNLAHKYICATTNVHMTCFEDIGSPLVQFEGNRAVLIGIVQNPQSYDKDVCGMGVAVFYRVSYFIDWLKDYIAANVTTHPPTAAISTTVKTTFLMTTRISTPAPAEKKNVDALAETLKINSTIILVSILYFLIHYLF